MRAIVVLGRRLTERGQRRDPLRGEPLSVQPPEPGDEDRVVLLASLVAAEVPKVADPAVVDRPRPRLVVQPGRRSPQKPLPRPSKERDELLSPQRLPLPVPSSTCTILGQPPLDPLELLGVEAELEDVERLRRARELRVHGLVRPVGCRFEEVREPAPGAVREVRLVDDVGLAGANRVLGGGARVPRPRSRRPRTCACARRCARRPRAAQDTRARARPPSRGGPARTGRRGTAARARRAARAARAASGARTPDGSPGRLARAEACRRRGASLEVSARTRQRLTSRSHSHAGSAGCIRSAPTSRPSVNLAVYSNHSRPPARSSDV